MSYFHQKNKKVQKVERTIRKYFVMSLVMHFDDGHNNNNNKKNDDDYYDSSIKNIFCGYLLLFNYAAINLFP